MFPPTFRIQITSRGSSYFIVSSYQESYMIYHGCNCERSADWFLLLLNSRSPASPRQRRFTHQHTHSATTNTKEQSPAWGTDSSSASQEIPRILRNPKIHYGFPNSPPPVPVLSQINLPQAIPHSTSLRSILISAYLNIGLSSGLLPSDLLIKTMYAPLLAPYVLHAPPVSFFLIRSQSANVNHRVVSLPNV